MCPHHVCTASQAAAALAVLTPSLALLPLRTWLWWHSNRGCAGTRPVSLTAHVHLIYDQVLHGCLQGPVALPVKLIILHAPRKHTTHDQTHEQPTAECTRPAALLQANWHRLAQHPAPTCCWVSQSQTKNTLPSVSLAYPLQHVARPATHRGLGQECCCLGPRCCQAKHLVPLILQLRTQLPIAAPGQD